MRAKEVAMMWVRGAAESEGSNSSCRFGFHFANGELLLRDLWDDDWGGSVSLHG